MKIYETKIRIIYEVPTAMGNWKTHMVTVDTFEEADLICQDILQYGYRLIGVTDVIEE